MAMVCPECRQVYEHQLQCRDCGCRLQFQATALQAAPIEDGELGGQWLHTPWGKIFVGFLLAQGLSFGLQQFVTAFWLASGEASGDVWATLWGLVLLHALQATGLLVGGAVSGAGQQRGVVLG